MNIEGFDPEKFRKVNKKHEGHSHRPHEGHTHRAHQDSSDAGLVRLYRQDAVR